MDSVDMALAMVRLIAMTIEVGRAPLGVGECVPDADVGNAVDRSTLTDEFVQFDQIGRHSRGSHNRQAKPEYPRPRCRKKTHEATQAAIRLEPPLGSEWSYAPAMD